MRSKGSRFTLGVWGLRVCSLDVAFMFATVSNRSQPSARSPYGRAYGKFCKRVTFGRFTCCVASFRVADVALRDIQTWFVTFFVWQARYFCDVFRRCVAVLRGRRRTLDVSCCVFLRIALPGLRRVATRCQFCGRRGIL